MSVKITKPPRLDNPNDQIDFQEQIERQLNLVGTGTIDLGSIAAGAVSTFTITVTGCRVGKQQSVAVAGPPALEANLMAWGIVTADNTVTIRVHNPTAGAIDPVSATWGCRVFL